MWHYYVEIYAYKLASPIVHVYADKYLEIWNTLLTQLIVKCTLTLLQHLNEWKTTPCLEKIHKYAVK